LELLTTADCLKATRSLLERPIRILRGCHKTALTPSWRSDGSHSEAIFILWKDAASRSVKTRVSDGAISVAGPFYFLVPSNARSKEKHEWRPRIEAPSRAYRQTVKAPAR
jgi:hypothetical protein